MVLRSVTVCEYDLPVQSLKGCCNVPVYELDLCGKSLGSMDAVIVGTLIASNEVLVTLDLRRNRLVDVWLMEGEVSGEYQDSGLIAIAHALGPTKLQRKTRRNNNNRRADTTSVSPVYNSTLRTLLLGDCFIGLRGLTGVSKL